MSGFQISGLQDDEPYDDIPSNLVSGYQNLGLQSNYSPAAPSVKQPPILSSCRDALLPARLPPRSPVKFLLAQISACEALTALVLLAVHRCTYAILWRGL
jgi:hypothetical protein